LKIVLYAFILTDLETGGKSLLTLLFINFCGTKTHYL